MEKITALEYTGYVIIDDKKELDFSQILCYLLTTTDLLVYPNKEGRLVIALPITGIFESYAEYIELDSSEIPELFRGLVNNNSDISILKFICKKVGKKPNKLIMDKLMEWGEWDEEMAILND